jgi:hypothetical protein
MQTDSKQTEGAVDVGSNRLLGTRQYKDIAGNPVTLDWIVKNEPEWAANQIRHRDKLEANAEACRKILGYNDGDLLDNVTRYHAYATHEIELLRAGGERVAAYARKLQELLPEDTVMKLGFTAVQETVASVPNNALSESHEI